MRTRDRRIDRHRPVDLPGRVGLGEDLRQHPIPRPVTGVTAMPLPHRLPRAELLAGQVTPRDPGAEPVRDALHNPPVVTERVTTPPGIGRQQRSDPLPLRIREHPISRTRRPHPTRLPRTSRCIWETRPSRTRAAGAAYRVGWAGPADPAPTPAVASNTAGRDLGDLEQQARGTPVVRDDDQTAIARAAPGFNSPRRALRALVMLTILFIVVIITVLMIALAVLKFTLATRRSARIRERDLRTSPRTTPKPPPRPCSLFRFDRRVTAVLLLHLVLAERRRLQVLHFHTSAKCSI